jgi:hypothetical protein
MLRKLRFLMTDDNHPVRRSKMSFDVEQNETEATP